MSSSPAHATPRCALSSALNHVDPECCVVSTRKRWVWPWPANWVLPWLARSSGSHCCGVIIIDGVHSSG